MTTPDTLAALSAKATPETWDTQLTDKDGPDYGVYIVANNLGGLVGAALPWPTEIEEQDFSRVEANAAFIVALVNAYRTGQLVPVPSVEAVARAACQSGGFDPDEMMPNDGPRWRYYEPIASAVIAAMRP